MKGLVKFSVVRIADSEVVFVQRRANLVVDTGYAELIRVLTGTSAAQHFVDRMQFGTGTAAPIAADAVLQTPITPVKAFSSVAYDDALRRVRFEAHLLAAEGNGFTVSEAGLLSVDGTVVARVVFSGVAKSADYLFTFRWDVLG